VSCFCGLRETFARANRISSTGQNIRQMAREGQAGEMMRKGSGSVAAGWAMAAATIMMTAMAVAQTAPAVPRQAGTVKSATADSLTLTNATGQDYTVSLPADAKILVVAPGAKDLKSATAGTPADVAAGDKVIVTGSATDTGTALTATRVILMKQSAIAESHAAEDAAWARGTGGIVKSVDVAAGKVTVSSGMKTITVSTTPTTIVRHYSGDSVRFADAQVTTLAAVKPGDQLRVRGTKSADGLNVTADEMVAGTFHNYSGLIASIDATAGTVTLKDLATKKTVTVAVTPSSDVRRLPPMVAMGIAARMKGGAAGAPSAGAAPAGAQGARGGAGRAGADLSQMISRMPTETLAGLKAGDAVMIVATTGSDASKSTAVTLLAGVDPILTASPSGEMTLTPWSVGGGEPTEGGGPQ
jgi:co-chaperonin GroES (HSP10)